MVVGDTVKTKKGSRQKIEEGKYLPFGVSFRLAPAMTYSIAFFKPHE